MILIFLLYGLPFFLLWVVIFVFPKRISRLSLPRNLWLIALFAILHGIHEWIEMFLRIDTAIHAGEPRLVPLRIIQLILLPASFYFLLAFAIRVMAGNRFLRLAPLLLLLAWTAVTFTSSRVFNAGDTFARYLLGAPGAFLTAYALILQTSEIAALKAPNLIRHLRLTAAGFVLYGFFAGLVVPDGTFFPASVLNYATFDRTFGLPIQIFRALCIFFITYGFARVLNMFEWHAIDAIQKAQESEVAQLAAIVQNSEDAIISSDSDGVIQTWNKGAEKIYGYSAEEIIGLPVSVMVPADRVSELSANFTKIRKGESVPFFDTKRLRKDGREIDVSLGISPLRNPAGEIIGLSGITRDITFRKRLEEQIKFEASHDTLTRLPTRTLFMELVEREVLQARRNRKKLALLFLDLDRFKEINDTLGHDFGDELLKQVAGRLKSCIRQSDSIARIGGDEFNILLSDLTHAEDAMKIVEKIICCFQESYIVHGSEMRITTSIGISIFPDDSEELDTLLRYADIAMYHAKESGRNAFQFYNDQINITSIERINLENRLRQAIERGELRLHFQPQMNIATGQLVSAEALLRWAHPDLGLLKPAQFLSIAEDTGLIVPIGEWVLQAACEQNRLWQQEGYRPISMTVNISDRQFRRVNLVELTEKILRDTRLDSRWLELEITENTIMRNAEFIIEKMNRLAKQGITLTLDDFGTGYSSLSYLKRLPITKIKVDKSFIRDIMINESDKAIVHAVIALTHDLNLKVIAEGVETEEQLSLLRTLACDGVQGNLVSPPLPARDFEKLLT